MISGQGAAESGRAGPKPDGLVLPKEEGASARPIYSVPREFLSADRSRFDNLEETPKWDLFSPRFFSHPFDYLRGSYEKKLLSSQDPKNYAPMDEEWEEAQTAASLFAVGATTLVMGYAGSKNLDGSGRIPFLFSKNGMTGKRGMGALPAYLLLRLPIHLTGGGLAAQHRPLQEEGLSPTQAYLNAANPLRGWPLVLQNPKQAFPDDVHGQINGNLVLAYVEQYTGRAANIGAAALYASTFPEDILPALKQILEKQQEFQRQISLEYLVHQEELLHLRQGQAGLAGKPAELLAKQAAIVEKEKQLARLGDRIQDLVQSERKLSFVWPTPIALNRKKALKMAEEELRALRPQLSGVAEKILHRLEKMKQPLQERNGTPVLHVIEDLSELQARQTRLRKAIDDLEKRVSALKKGEIEAIRELSKRDARQLARAALRGGPALELLEETRNFRMELTALEKALAEPKDPVGRLLYNARRMYGGGRWKVGITRYASLSGVYFIEGILVNHFALGESWSESVKQAVSVFYRMALNDPLVQGLKTAGVKKVPQIVTFTPSSIVDNAVLSVTLQDKTLALENCRRLASSLLHSLDPEYRESIRSQIKKWHDMANPSELERWYKPRSEGGCGLP